MSKKELIEQIKNVILETGIGFNNWTSLMRELNNRNIYSSRGRLWSIQNLSDFCRRNNINLDSPTTNIQLSDIRSSETNSSTPFINTEKTTSRNSKTTTSLNHQSEITDSNIPQSDIPSSYQHMSTLPDTTKIHNLESHTSVCHLSDIFTDEEIRVLKQMVQERINSVSTPTRIEFDRKKVVRKSLRLPEQMVNDAMRREENFNKLMEMLLWDFLDRDQKYLKR